MFWLAGQSFGACATYISYTCKFSLNTYVDHGFRLPSEEIKAGQDILKKKMHFQGSRRPSETQVGILQSIGVDE